MNDVAIMIKPMILWSDVLIFTLLAGLLIFVRSVRKRPETSRKWLQVFQSRVGMSSFIVIMVYIFIALLDSIHYREALPFTQAQIDNNRKEAHYSNEIKSVLDWVLLDMKSNSEKTYSAPFALYSFAKENMYDDQARLYRDFPRLPKAGRHIENESDKLEDIASRSIRAIAVGALVALLFVIILHLLRKVMFKELQLSWRTIYITLFVALIVIVWTLKIGAVYHILGTDKVGTDVLYQSIKSIRTGVLIGTLATILTLPLAIILGISAGYFKGWIDDLVQYVYTTLNSIPGILLIAASILLIDVYIETHQADFKLTIERADFKFLSLCLILGLTSWTSLCRLLRAETLKISQLDYVQAAHAFGVKHHKIISRHILPNIMHIVLISLVLDFSGFVLAESVLSYIGVGVDASMISWGNMINAARSELSRDPTVWWSVTSAFILMFTLVLAANLFSDEVREAFDPRIVRESEGGKQ